MEPEGRRLSQLSRLRSVRRREADGAGISPFRTEPLRPGSLTPLVVIAADPAADVVAWARDNRDALREHLHRHGAILVRDCGIDSIERFEQLMLTQVPELFGDYGDLPRAGESGRVYQSTPYPEDMKILFHNESSHLHCWPMRIAFYCVQPARKGGETPIFDCREVYRRMRPEVRDRFEQLGLCYVRNFTESLDVSWQAFFGTDSRSRVESYCREAGMECEWTAAGGLRTRQFRPAVATHPYTGERLFFNQVQLHHPYCLGAEVRSAMRSMFSEDEFPRQVYFGNGSPIEDAVMEELDTLFRECAVQFPWQKHDVLILDNMLIAHSRNPYEGPRRIVVAMGEMAGKVVTHAVV